MTKIKAVFLLASILFILTGCNSDLPKALGAFEVTFEKDFTEHMNTSEQEIREKT